VSRDIDNTAIAFDGGGTWIDETTYRLSLSADYEAMLSARDGIPVDEWQRYNSDLIISKDKREHAGEIMKDKERIDIKIIRDKRNLYGILHL